MKTVAIVGTLDTKGQEIKFIKDIIASKGLGTLVVDVGIKTPYFTPDVSNETVAQATGVTLQEIIDKNERSFAMEMMSKGIAKVSSQLFSEGKFDGVISIGGSGGSSLAAAFMRELPVGVPKLLVSTMASGDTRPYVGVSDVTMMYSVVDVAGINSISSTVLSNASHAIIGMLTNEVQKPKEKKPLVAATMFGVTTPCVTKAQEVLEKAGYEVLVFHATGTGGKSMENLIESGFISGVLDMTTTEWCDELVGGILSAGPNRLEAAGKSGVPQVVSVGALDMVNFGPYDTVPEKFKDRNLYRHNPTITLMRTTVEENIQLGKIIAEKLNKAKSPTTLMLPLKGVSAIDKEGQAFYGPEEDAALFETLKKEIDPNVVELVEVDTDINDPTFAVMAAEKLIKLMQEAKN